MFKHSLAKKLNVATINGAVSYNSIKDEQNKLKHGVSLARATELEWDSLLAMQDVRNDYGEIRMIGFALLGERLFCVVYTDRNEERRIISLRKANKREVEFYVSQN